VEEGREKEGKRKERWGTNAGGSSRGRERAG